MTEFAAIMADPPWLERGGGKIKRGADRHYKLLHTREIPVVMTAAPVWRPAENSHLYLWATNNFLKDGLWVMAELGFRYITTVTWAKDRIGLGQYFRGQTEHMLFGVRGRLPALVRTESTLIVAPRRKHSQKPEAAYERIERVSPGPYLEMFARGGAVRGGWTAWGNEAAVPGANLAEGGGESG